MATALKRRSVEADGPVRVVVRSSLRCIAGSSSNREHARRLVWQWVGAKWPRLVPGAAELQQDVFERSLPGMALAVARPAREAWQLSVAHQEPGGARVWRTQVAIGPMGDAD